MLLQRPCHAETRRALFDDEHRDVAITARRTGLGGDEINVAIYAIGDEHLGAVQHPLIALAMRRAAHASEIRAGVGFGHGDCCDALAGDDVGHVALELFLGTGVMQMRARHIGMHQHRHRETAVGRAAEFFGQQCSSEGVHFTAAVLRGVADAEQPQAAHLAHDLARHHAIFFPGICVR